MVCVKFNQKINRLKREFIEKFKNEGYSHDDAHDLAVKKLYEISLIIKRDQISK